MRKHRTTKSCDKPLSVRLVGDRLVIEIGVRTLAFACEHGPTFAEWNAKASAYQHPKVTDPFSFAADVLRELCDEEEDGTTPVHSMLDAAMDRAINNGSESVQIPSESPSARPSPDHEGEER